MAATTVPPDTKDWTWVLDRPCPACGFVADAVDPGDLGRLLRSNAERWQEVLRRPDVGVRPARDVWSALEYGCHVRDVHRVMTGRVRLMVDQTGPVFPDWDQDATAVEERYDEQLPATVAEELTAAATAATAAYEAVTGEAWDRSGLRSNGSRFTIASLGRYHLHDVVHHLHDVGG